MQAGDKAAAALEAELPRLKQIAHRAARLLVGAVGLGTAVEVLDPAQAPRGLASSSLRGAFDRWIAARRRAWSWRYRGVSGPQLLPKCRVSLPDCPTLRDQTPRPQSQFGGAALRDIAAFCREPC